jgi:hypothetical protein
MLEIVLFIVVLNLGIFIGYVLRVYLTKSNYVGTINITETPEKTIYSLDLSRAPEDIALREEVIFKVNPSEADLSQ